MLRIPGPRVNLTAQPVAAPTPIAPTKAPTADDDLAAILAAIQDREQAPALPPILEATKSHEGDWDLGYDYFYQVRVTNVGEGPTTGPITITDTLPEGLEYVSYGDEGGSYGWSCSADGQTVTCTNSAILAPSDQSTPLWLQVHVTGGAPEVTNTATATTGGADPASADDPTTIIAPPAPCWQLRWVGQSDVIPYINLDDGPVSETIVIVDAGGVEVPSDTVVGSDVTWSFLWMSYNSPSSNPTILTPSSTAARCAFTQTGSIDGFLVVKAAYQGWISEISIDLYFGEG